MNTAFAKALPFSALLLATNAGAQPVANAPLPDCISLDGKVAQPNPVEKDGRIIHFKSPALRLMRTAMDNPKGTVLILPSGGYHVLSVVSDGTDKAKFWNNLGYDAAILEYTISEKSGNRDDAVRDAALKDTLAAVHTVRNTRALGMRGDNFILMGGSAGGHLAARTVAALPENERPNAVVLFYPAYLDEIPTGAQTAGMPLPTGKLPRLFVAIASNDDPKWIASARAYTEAWNKAPGGTGKATFHLFDDGGHGFRNGSAAAEWPQLLTTFVTGK